MSDDYPPAPQPQAGGYPAPPPPNHLVMAIVTTVACCLPFGIVSMVYANKVNALWQTGHYDEAVEASNKAKNWWIVSIVGFFVGAILYGIGILVFADNFGDFSDRS